MLSLQLHYVRETRLQPAWDRKFVESMRIVADRDLKEQIHENKTKNGEFSWKLPIILLCSTIAALDTLIGLQIFYYVHLKKGVQKVCRVQGTVVDYCNQKCIRYHMFSTKC